ncbi:MAG: ABC transporter ATP-binding protein [Deltaproteobacteria bacterium]|nr:ABC transporter ATP-binding protein [Deltaproteobacteria bacterium]
MIELENVSKKYGDTLAVDTLSLFVPGGEIFGFIGPNGAGKTTTINMMGGILSPTSGIVKICGINMATHPEKTKGKIGFIPDRPYLYEKLSGMEFLKFTADLYSVNADVFYRRAEEKLEMFSLLDRANDLIESYSHGMKQRLIMAAALLHEPDVIIVDEPMVGLDPAGIKMVKELFGDLARGGVTIFMSTHTLTVAEDVCDRIGIIHKGSLIATGTARELKERASAVDADLEHVFIRLTQEAHDVQAAVGEKP